MNAPLIGLTTFRQLNKSGNPLISVNEAYLRALSRSGAIPVPVPLGLSEDALTALLDRLDGIVFTGGGDVHPERYGSQPHPLVDDVDADRDRVEIHLFQQTLRSGKPFLGICRGLQVINVAQGGTLYEDILDQRAGALKHQYGGDQPRDYLAHEVRLDAGSRLAETVGLLGLQVNSLHHQGIREVGTQLRPTAFAPDGLVEAIELADYPFGLAVQWHPEWLLEHAPMQAIFAAFVQAAQLPLRTA